MPTNEFLPYASGGSPNVLSQAAYAAAAARTAGVVNGTADAELANKAWRQPANMAAALGMLINDYGLLDALDDGNIPNLEAGLLAAIRGSLSNTTGLFFRKRLTTNTTFYVATTGNDSTGDGTSGTPWATIQHAVDVIRNSYDLAGYTATVNVAAGTYAPLAVSGPIVGGNLVIAGASSATTTVNGGSANAFAATYGATYKITGFTMTSAAGSCVFVGHIGNIELGGDLVFGSAGGTAQIASAHPGSGIYVTGNYSITGGAVFHVLADFNSAIIYTPNVITVTLTGTPAFSTAFAGVAVVSLLDAQGITFSGSATGTRFSADGLGVIRTNGAGASYFPGNASGVQTNGGIKY